MTTCRRTWAITLLMTLVMASGAGLAACGGGGTPTTTSSTSTTTSTIATTPSAERALFRGWCALKVGALSSTTSAIGRPYLHGSGPVAVFHQNVPQGINYAVWPSRDYALEAWFVGTKIYSLTAFPRVIPSVVKLGCSDARKL